MSTIRTLSNGVHNPTNFDVEKDIPSLANKVILVTGGNSGIGKESVIQFAKHNPQRLYLAARSQAKYDAAMKDVVAKVPDAKVDFLELDLASFESIKKAADKVIAENDHLNILMNSAGIMAAPHGMTKEGYEIHFGTNHMGHALLTHLLLPLLTKTAEQTSEDVRIINVTSAAQSMAPGDGIVVENLKSDCASTHEYVLYGISKLANIVHARQLAKRYPTVLSVSVHPGRVDTALLDDYFKGSSWAAYFQKTYDWMVGKFTPEQGALSQLWAANWKKEDVENGGYYTPVGDPGKIVPKGMDEKIADHMWDWQEAEFKRLGY